jgi:chaperonin GroEL (HSP60 family)
MASDHDDAVRSAAAWVERFVAAGYGPGGGHKLVAAGPPVLVETAAAALAEAHAGPWLQPYAELARRTEAFAGDQSATAVLLAAGLVRRALDGPARRAAYIEGYALARRQALATAAATAREVTAAQALATVAPPLADEVERIAAGLAALGPDERGGTLDLDRVDVVVEAAEHVEWADGLVLRPQGLPAADGGGTRVAAGVPFAAGARVAIASGGWTPKPRREGVTARASRVDAAAGEDALRERVRRHLRALGVGVVVCGGALDEDLAARLQQDGAVIVTDAGADTLRRAADATGATLVTRLDAVEDADLGRADVVRRPARRGGILLRGVGPARTLIVPQRVGVEMKDHAERLLRAAGQWLADPRAVAGGGRWQRGVARSLRSAADAAPGRTPFAFRAAADAVEALADIVARNLGLDPRRAEPPACHDLWPAVRQAIAGGFDAAVALLRVDSTHARRASTTEALRGGRGRPGSPRGMPGDVPPLM